MIRALHSRIRQLETTARRMPNPAAHDAIDLDKMTSEEKKLLGRWLLIRRASMRGHPADDELTAEQEKMLADAVQRSRSR